MNAPLIECIPNISEGQDRAVIDSIAAVIPGEGVSLLDVSYDRDHHRTVFTFCGTPEAVEDAMIRAARIAVKQIHMEKHIGVHPRVGAVDVVPFVPLRGISLAECAVRAREFGRRFAQELAVPVYLYEAAALRPNRVNLANIRRGGYEALKQEITVQPDRMPDFGPRELGSAGATVIGARNPLIAFNAYLDTDNVMIAHQIAASIRESGGGLSHLKAIGVLVGGRAQVSMNVIDFRLTSLYTILRVLEEEARDHHVSVVHTELVGLIPQSALIAAGLEALRLPANVANATLERRLGDLTGDYREVPFE